MSRSIAHFKGQGPAPPAAERMLARQLRWEANAAFDEFNQALKA